MIISLFRCQISQRNLQQNTFYEQIIIVRVQNNKRTPPRSFATPQSKMSELIPLKLTVMKSQRDLKIKTIEYIDECEVKLVNMKNEAHREYLEKKAEYERILRGDALTVKKFTLMTKLLKRKLQLLQKYYKQKKLIKYFMTIVIKRQLIIRLTYSKYQYINQLKQQNVAGLQEKLNTTIQRYNQVVTCKINTLVQTVNNTTNEYVTFLKKKQLHYKLLKTKYLVIVLKKVLIQYQNLKYKKLRYNQCASKKKVLLSHIQNNFQFMQSAKRFNPQQSKNALEALLAQYKKIKNSLHSKEYAQYIIKYAQLLKLQKFKQNLNNSLNIIQSISNGPNIFSKQQLLDYKLAELKGLKHCRESYVQILQVFQLEIQKYNLCEKYKGILLDKAEKIKALKAHKIMRFHAKQLECKVYELNKISKVHRLRQFQRTGDQKLLVLQQIEDKVDLNQQLRYIRLKLCLGYKRYAKLQTIKCNILVAKRVQLSVQLLNIKNIIYLFEQLLIEFKHDIKNNDKRQKCLAYAMQHQKIEQINKWIKLLLSEQKSEPRVLINRQNSRQNIIKFLTPSVSVPQYQESQLPDLQSIETPKQFDKKLVIRQNCTQNALKYVVPYNQQSKIETLPPKSPTQSFIKQPLQRQSTEQNILKYSAPKLGDEAVSTQPIPPPNGLVTNLLKRTESQQNEIKYKAPCIDTSICAGEQKTDVSTTQDQNLVLLGNGDVNNSQASNNDAEQAQQNESQLSSNSVINSLQQSGAQSVAMENHAQVGSLQSRSGLSGDNFNNSDYGGGYEASSSTSFARGSSSSISEGEDVSEI